MALTVHPPRARRQRGVTSEGEAHLSKLKWLSLGAALNVLLVVDCIYLLAFGFSKGLDSTSSDFARYWYPVLAFNVLVMFPTVTAAILAMWKTPCRTCTAQRAAGGVDPEHELQHHWMFLSLLLVGALALVGQLAIGLGGDASWHQSSLRDTSITPIHILGFYGFAPLQFIGIIGSYVYARTRIPELFGAHRGMSVAYALFAGSALFGMLNFTFNEFGHSMWIYEELFTYPMHYPFVVFSATNAAIFALTVPTLMRVSQILTGARSAEAAAAFERDTLASANA